jgi:hypothetical protein
MPDSWVALDVLAEALSTDGNPLTPDYARAIASREGIRTTPTRPRRYWWPDIVDVSRRRRTKTGETR